METSMGFQRGSATALSHFRGWESYVVFDDCPVDQYSASLWFSFEKDIGKGWKIEFDSEQMHLNPQKLLEALVVWTIHHPNLFEMPVPLLKVLAVRIHCCFFLWSLITGYIALPYSLPLIWRPSIYKPYLSASSATTFIISIGDELPSRSLPIDLLFCQLPWPFGVVFLILTRAGSSSGSHRGGVQLRSLARVASWRLSRWGCSGISSMCFQQSIT